MAMNTYLLIITLNVNGLVAIKRHKVAKWIRNRLRDMLSIRNPLQIKRHKQTKSEWMEKGIS